MGSGTVHRGMYGRLAGYYEDMLAIARHKFAGSAMSPTSLRKDVLRLDFREFDGAYCLGSTFVTRKVG